MTDYPKLIAVTFMLLACAVDRAGIHEERDCSVEEAYDGAASPGLRKYCDPTLYRAEDGYGGSDARE